MEARKLKAQLFLKQFTDSYVNAHVGITKEEFEIVFAKFGCQEISTWYAVL